MSIRVFVDTNILIYAHTDANDPRHAAARRCVQTLWDEPGIAAVSVQVLQELHVNLLRKGRLDVASSAAIVENYLKWRVIDNDRLALTRAMSLQTRWQLSSWDAMIVGAALRAGAAELWSEDLNDGQVIERLTIRNPLR